MEGRNQVFTVLGARWEIIAPTWLQAQGTNGDMILYNYIPGTHPHTLSEFCILSVIVQRLLWFLFFSDNVVFSYCFFILPFMFSSYLPFPLLLLLSHGCLPMAWSVFTVIARQKKELNSWGSRHYLQVNMVPHRLEYLILTNSVKFVKFLPVREVLLMIQ